GATSHCETSTGTCVECLDSGQCSGAKSICDESTHECRGCAIDSECPSRVCDLDTATCVADTNIIYASTDGAPLGVCGTLTQPCNFTAAQTHLDATKTIIKLLPGTYTNLSIDTKSFEVEGSEAVVMPADTTSTGVNIVNDSHVRIVGLTITR